MFCKRAQSIRGTGHLRVLAHSNARALRFITWRRKRVWSIAIGRVSVNGKLYGSGPDPFPPPHIKRERDDARLAICM